MRYLMIVVGALLASTASATWSLTNESCNGMAGYLADESELIDIEDIDHKLAIPACLNELSEDPANHELNFFLGRALEANGQHLQALDRLVKAYRLGNAEAAASITDIYYYGNAKILRDWNKYYEWSEKAHEAGSAYGTYSLAYAFDHGIGVISDLEKAKDLYEIAHESGELTASLKLAELYAYGAAEVSKDVKRAQEIWKGLKIDGVEKAWINEAIFFLNNSESTEQLINAILNLNRFIEIEHPTLKSELAFINMLPENYKFAEQEDVKRLLSIDSGFELGIAMLETEFMLNNFGEYFLNQTNAHFLSPDQVTKLHEELEKIFYGDKPLNAILAGRILADFHLEGLFEEKNIEKVITYLKYSVEHLDDYIAAEMLSDLFREEAGYRNPELAIRYAEFASQSPEPFVRATAFYTLGLTLAYNHDVQDMAKALEYFKRSAEVIDQSKFIFAGSFEQLANIYLFGGDGVARNVDAAKKFAAKIEINGGDPFIQYFLSRYEILSDTSDDTLVELLEESFFDGKVAAADTLALFHELRGNNAEMYRWANVCSLLCPEEWRLVYTDWTVDLNARLLAAELSHGQKSAATTIANFYQKNLSVETAKIAVEKSDIKPLGRLHALLIGNSSYKSLPNLDTPIKDIRAIGEVIEAKFSGSTIYVEDGSRREIMGAFKELAKKVAEEDSVMIFFAGHGKMIKAQDEGYWLPSDADPDDEFNWIPNSYIKSKVRALKARNVLLVADSCFSGLLTRGLEMPSETNSSTRIEEFQKTPSRIVISSGGLEPVLDGFGGNNSIFANEFLKILEEGNNPLTSTELYTSIRDRVVEKSIKIGVKQVPFMATLVAEGHEGPDFVFIPN